MTDYSALREHARLMIGRRFETIAVDLVVLIDVLDELASLRKQGKLPKPKRVEYPVDFLLAYGSMAWRSGSTRSAAFGPWKARIAAGATAAEIQTGVEKYYRYCAATGCEVKQAQTFFGPGEHFTADWSIRKAGVQQGEKFNFSGMDRTGDQAAQAASIAKHGIVIPDGEVKF